MTTNVKELVVEQEALYQQENALLRKQVTERDQIILYLLRKGLVNSDEEIEQIARLYRASTAAGGSQDDGGTAGETDPGLRGAASDRLSDDSGSGEVDQTLQNDGGETQAGIPRSLGEAQGPTEVALSQAITYIADLQKAMQNISQEKDSIITQQARQITELREYKTQVNAVLTNQGMSHRDRVTWCVTHILYGQNILAGKPFHADMAKIQRLAGVGKNATGELFAAMAEAGGIKHDWDREKYREEGATRDSWSSTVVITPLLGNALVNTKDTEVRQRQRDASAQSATRRIERLVSVAIEACPHCGCDDPAMAQTVLVPRCKACGKVRNPDSPDSLVATSALRIVEVIEEPVQSDFATPSAQDVPSREVPIRQDTSPVDESANTSEGSNEVPEEPDDIRAQYEEWPTDQDISDEISEEPECESSEVPTSMKTTKSVPMGMPTSEDERTFRKAVTQAKIYGLDRPCGKSVFTYRDILHDLEPIIKSKEPVEVKSLQWVRSEMARILGDLPSGQTEGGTHA